MNDLKSFIDNKIKASEQELKDIDEQIAKKAGPLLQKKTGIEKKANDLRSILREYDKSNKPQK